MESDYQEIERRYASDPKNPEIARSFCEAIKRERRTDRISTSVVRKLLEILDPNFFKLDTWDYLSLEKRAKENSIPLNFYLNQDFILSFRIPEEFFPVAEEILAHCTGIELDGDYSSSQLEALMNLDLKKVKHLFLPNSSGLNQKILGDISRLSSLENLVIFYSYGFEIEDLTILNASKSLNFLTIYTIHPDYTSSHHHTDSIRTDLINLEEVPLQNISVWVTWHMEIPDIEETSTFKFDIDAFEWPFKNAS